MSRRRWQRAIVAGVLSVALPLVAAPARSDAGAALLGVYYGNQGWEMDRVRALEAWQGKRHAVVNVFTNWDAATRVRKNLFSQQLPNVWANGNVPMITWEPFTGKTTPADVEQRVAAGQYDTYLADWADRLARFLDGSDGKPGTADDRRAYLRLAHEMNGNWYPWSGAPDDFVRMWRRVHAAFDARGLGPSRLQWVWAVNHEDVGGIAAEDYWPGDGFVDWLAVDGYNWGASQPWSSWRSPAEVLDPMVQRLRRLAPTGPLAVTETATTSDTGAGSNLTAKSQWVTALFDYAAAAQARMVVWFNEDKETDWAVFGGARGDTTVKIGRTTYRALSVYRTGVGRPDVIASTSTNPRLLTDAQFAGILP